MRKVCEEKQSIDLSQKIKVEVSLKEALILAASVGRTSDGSIGSFIESYYGETVDLVDVGLGGTGVLAEDDPALQLFRELLEILANEGIEEDEG